MTDEDFETWLDTIPAIPTLPDILKYKSYMSTTTAAGQEPLNFSEWRLTLK